MLPAENFISFGLIFVLWPICHRKRKKRDFFARSVTKKFARKTCSAKNTLLITQSQYSAQKNKIEELNLKVSRKRKDLF